MKWKLLLRNLSVSAPRVTVRSQLPPWIRFVLFFLLTASAAALGMGIYEYGRNFAGPDRHDLLAKVDQLQLQVREVTAERDRYAALQAAGEAQLKVERAAQQQLVEQARSLEIESNKLREDLAFFDSLLPAGTGNKDVVIRSFRVQPADEPNQMRYRLLVQQSGKPEHDFVGSVELVVNFSQGGRNFVLQMPEPNAPAERVQAFALGFRHYQRVEGTFALPPGATARSCQVRILTGSTTRLQQTFTL
ncbi:MAG TPA: DUF6776 family protein [Burkholderiaceae bacterium]|nr:DUF6776 family protein [Burkholderiaceae bacterium]